MLLFKKNKNKISTRRNSDVIGLERVSGHNTLFPLVNKKEVKLHSIVLDLLLAHSCVHINWFLP